MGWCEVGLPKYQKNYQSYAGVGIGMGGGGGKKKRDEGIQKVAILSINDGKSEKRMQFCQKMTILGKLSKFLENQKKKSKY